MRFLFKISLPVEAGNAAAKEGFKATTRILEEQKPEAIYFVAEGLSISVSLFSTISTNESFSSPVVT